MMQQIAHAAQQQMHQHHMIQQQIVPHGLVAGSPILTFPFTNTHNHAQGLSPPITMHTLPQVGLPSLTQLQRVMLSQDGHGGVPLFGAGMMNGMMNCGAYGTWPGAISPAVFPGAVPMHSAGMMQVPEMSAAAAASFPVANGSEVASQAGATSGFSTFLMDKARLPAAKTERLESSSSRPYFLQPNHAQQQHRHEQERQQQQPLTTATAQISSPQTGIPTAFRRIQGGLGKTGQQIILTKSGGDIPSYGPTSSPQALDQEAPSSSSSSPTASLSSSTASQSDSTTSV